MSDGPDTGTGQDPGPARTRRGETRARAAARAARRPAEPAGSPASAPDDGTLTVAGLAPAGDGRILLIGCGALAHEVLALKRLNGWDHMDLHCLPANLHLWPDRIPDAVTRAVEAARDRYGQIFVLYADCGTGGLLQARCAELGVEMLEGPHCYSFFEGNAAFAKRAGTEISAFYLTDFLVRQFDAFVWRPMGFDRNPELIPMMFANYTTLVHQAQVPDPGLRALAEACANRLGLTFEYRLTGYGDLGHALQRLTDPPARPG